MDVYDKGLITIVACDALFILISIPLVLRKVPRNSVYGYRTPSTLSADDIWYDANAYFGRWFIIACAASAVAILILASTRTLSPPRFLVGSVAALVLPILSATILTARFIHLLKRR